MSTIWIPKKLVRLSMWPYTRCFLMHQADPAVTLVAIARLVRRGGWIVAQEPLRYPTPISHPRVPARSATGSS
jgi:hypothetical protein